MSPMVGLGAATTAGYALLQAQPFVVPPVAARLAPTQALRTV